MNRPPVTEIWVGKQVQLRLDGHLRAQVGELISMKSGNYEVVAISWSIDHSDSVFETQSRLNLIVKKVK